MHYQFRIVPILIIGMVLSLSIHPQVQANGMHSSASAAPSAWEQGEKEFVYMLETFSDRSNRIEGFVVDSVNGTLNLLPGFPLDTGQMGDDNPYSAVEQLVYHAESQRLYALNDGNSDSVSVYHVDTVTGMLSELPYSPINLGIGVWLCLDIPSGGSPLVVGGATAESTGLVRSFNVSDTTATPANNQGYTTGVVIPYSCEFSRDGDHFYTGGYHRSKFAGFRVAAASGTLTALPGSPFDVGSNLAYPAAYATDDAGRLLMAQTEGNTGQNPQHVGAYMLEQGTPVAVAGNPFASGLIQAYHGIWHPDGYYMVADRARAAVGVYRITGSGPATTLSPVIDSPFTAATTFIPADGTAILALNRNGSLLFAANVDTHNTTTFLVDRINGTLTEIWQTINDAPEGHISGMVTAAAVPSPAIDGYLYALRDSIIETNQIYGFGVDTRTGMLLPLPGFPITTSGRGKFNVPTRSERMAVDWHHNRLYVINAGSNTLDAYAIDPATGSLQPLPFSPIALGNGISWTCLAVHPSGSPVVVGDWSRLLSFNISADAAVQAEGSPYMVSRTTMDACHFSQDGMYLYGGTPDIASMRVDANTGVLTKVAGSPFASGVRTSISTSAIDAQNRLFLLETAETTATQALLSVFTTADGVPTAITQPPLPTTLMFPAHSVYHPDGLLLVIDKFLNNFTWYQTFIGVYRINGSGAATTVEMISSIPPEVGIGQHPFPAGHWGGELLALDTLHDRLFVAYPIDMNISTFDVNTTTGKLSGRSIQPQGTLGTATDRDISGLVYVALLPDLEVTLRNSGLEAGQRTDYTLRVHNRSAADIIATTHGPIQVHTTFSAALTYVSADGNGWQCDSTAADVTCTHNDALAGGNYLPDLTLHMQVSDTASGDIVVDARVEVADEQARGNNHARVVTSLEPDDQQITFAAIANHRLNDSPVSLNATASSGLLVTFTSETPNICTISATSVSLLATGECRITAQQPGNARYNPAPSVQQVFQVLPNEHESLEHKVFLPLLVR